MMWQIIKKNYRQLALFLLFFCSVLAVVRILIGNELSIAFVLIGGMSIFVSLLGVIFISEQYEEKNHGYAIMEILPLKNAEIVTAKYLMLLVMCVLLTGFLIALFSLSEAKPQEMSLIRSYMILMGSGSLLLVGILYIGIFAIGYTKFLIGFLLFTTALGLVPAVLMRSERDNVGLFIEKTLEWLPNANWSLYLPVIIVVYLGLMWISIQLKSQRSSS